jgi:hypothetical protein
MLRQRALPLLAALAALPAWAFKPTGHDIIEATAYKRLMNGEALYRLPTGERVPGREIVRGLIEGHALLPPECFDVSSDSDAQRCQAEQARYSGLGWPALTTGSLDELFDRQFDSVGQCFHFMARGSDVWANANPDPATGVPPGLGKDAYVRCENLMEALMARILRDPYTRADRLYALMHAITDSFSAAHTERIGPRVSYLRPWDLLTWAPYHLHRGTLRYLDTPAQHAVIDKRDDDYLIEGGSVEGKACAGFAHPYQVPEGCLTGRALDAVSALVDLLVLTDGLLALDRQPGSQIDAPAAAAWTDYVRSHLDSAEFQPPAKLQTNVGEWRPQRAVGVRFERDLNLTGTIPNNTVEATSIAAVVQLIHAEPAILPFNLTSDFELGGSRLTPGRSSLTGPRPPPTDALHLGVELPAVLPIADYIALGVTPLRVVGDVGPRTGGGWGLIDLDYRLGARMEVILRPGVWVGVSYPFFSWTTTQFHPWDFSIVAGYSIKEPRSSAQGGSLPFLDGSRWNPAEKTDGSVPPPLGLLGISFTNVTAQNLFIVTARFTSDYDPWMNRRGFGWGVELGSFIDETADRTNLYGGLSTGAAVRYYILANLLAAEVRPVTAQWTTHLPGEVGHHVFEFDDLGGDAGLVVPLSVLEVHVYSPRWRYTPGAPGQYTPRGLQIGLTFNFARL